MQKFLSIVSLVMLAWSAGVQCQGITQPVKPCTPNGTVDVLLIIDSSAGVSTSTYDNMLSFAADLPGGFILGPTGVQFSAMTFANSPTTVFDFDKYGAGQSSGIQQAIQSSPYKGGPTNTHLALQTASSSGFSVVSGARAGAPKIALVFTNGHSANNAQTIQEANRLKAYGVFVIAIGTDDAQRAELEAIASSPQAVYNLDLDFKSVQDIIRDYSIHANCENPSAINSCHGYQLADVIFVLDSSTSIGPSNYQLQLAYVDNITTNFDLGPTDLRFGAVLFSTGAQTLFNLDDYTTHATLSSAILSAQYLQGGTDTDVALNYVKDNNLFGTANGGRTNATKVVIVMTDGRSNSQTLTTLAAQRLKDDGAFIFAIGVGDSINPDELKAIASNNESYFQVDDFNALPTIISTVTHQLCETIVPPVTLCTPNGTADVLYIIDSSSGVSNSTHNTMLNFAANLPENFLMGSSAIQFSGISYAGSPTNLFNFNTYGAGQYRDLQQTILTAPLTGGTTNTHLALQNALTNSFTIETGARPGAPQIALVFTDGHSANNLQTIQQANFLKASGVFVVAIGSATANRAEMEVIASSPQAVFNVDTDFRNVRDIISLYANHEGCKNVSRVRTARSIERMFAILYSTQHTQPPTASAGAKAVAVRPEPDLCAAYTLQDGLYPDPGYCYGFIQCSNYHTGYFDCPLGLGFNTASRSCDDTHLIDCNVNANYYSTGTVFVG